MQLLQLLFTFISAIIGGLVVIGGWLLFLGRKSQVIDDLKEGFQKIQSNIAQITNAIVEIQTHLSGRGFDIRYGLAITHQSPMSLTEYGEQLMRESGFYQIAEQNKRLLVDLVKGKNPKTNYDVQELSYQVLKELATQNDPIAVPIKNYAYEKGLALDFLLQTAGIVLRDLAMTEIKFDDQTLEGIKDGMQPQQ